MQLWRPSPALNVHSLVGQSPVRPILRYYAVPYCLPYTEVGRIRGELGAKDGRIAEVTAERDRLFPQVGGCAAGYTGRTATSIRVINSQPVGKTPWPKRPPLVVALH